MHLTPQFFFAKTNLLFIWNTSAKIFFDSDKPSIFCGPTKSRNSHFCWIWGEWRLPRKIEYLPSSHFHEDNAIHIRKVRRNAFQRYSRLLQQYPRYKERYTVQFNGDDRSIVQWKRKWWLILSNYRTSDLTLWEPLKNSKWNLFRRLSNAIFKIFCRKPVSNL